MIRCFSIVIAFLLSVGYAFGAVKYYPPVTLTSDSIVSFSHEDKPAFEALEIRGSMPKISSNHQKESYYGVRWQPADVNTVVELRIIPCIENFETLLEEGILDIEVFLGDSLIQRSSYGIGIDIKRTHSIAIEFFNGREVSIVAGTDKFKPILTLPAHFSYPDSLVLFTNSPLKINDLIHETIPNPADALATDYTLDTLKSTLAELNNAGHGGFWTFLDRNTDEEYAKIGGKYTLAVVPAEGNCFDIIYVSGGTINLDNWRTGMLKGRLTPTIFKNHYNLQWFDAEMNELIDECSAQFDDNNAILTLSFPLHKSTLRLSKIVNPQVLRDM